MKATLKRLTFLSLALLGSTALATTTYTAFVSFSMPEPLLWQTLRDASAHDIPAVLNGLYEDSMPKTIAKIQAISLKVPNLSLQIDPTAYERFAITQVPALVAASGNRFDVIYGNIAMESALERLRSQGELR